MAVISVPDEFVGKSLSDLRGMRSEPFRADVLASMLGIGDRTPFTEGQSFNFNFNDPGSGEQQFLQKVFKMGPGISAAQKSATSSLEAGIPETEQKFTQLRGQLEAEKDPIKARYQDLLTELSRREGVETQATEQNLSREFGKRGIPLSSGVFSQDLAKAKTPINQYYTGQQRTVNSAQEEALRQLTNDIANTYTNETEAKRVLRNAIAQMQFQQERAAADDALAQANLQLQQASLQLNRDRYSNIELPQQQMQQNSYNQITLPSALAALNAKNRTSSSSSVSRPSLDSLFQNFLNGLG